MSVVILSLFLNWSMPTQICVVLGQCIRGEEIDTREKGYLESKALLW